MLSLAGTAATLVGLCVALLYFAVGWAWARGEKLLYVTILIRVWALALLGGVLGWWVSGDAPLLLAWYVACFMTATVLPLLAGVILGKLGARPPKRHGLSHWRQEED